MERGDTDLASGGSEELLLLLQILPFGCQGLLLRILFTPQVAGQTRARAHGYIRSLKRPKTHGSHDTNKISPSKNTGKKGFDQNSVQNESCMEAKERRGDATLFY